MSNQEANSNQSGQETSNQSEESIAFNSMIWANSLLGTGNTSYQNSFYEKQALKIAKRYGSIVAG